MKKYEISMRFLWQARYGLIVSKQDFFFHNVYFTGEKASADIEAAKLLEPV